jgi:plasmid stabilization system protein ParE
VSYSLHREAEKDLTDAFRFYKREAGSGVAARFLSEFERVVALLEDFPEMGTPTNERRRSYPLTGFPYSVIYRHVEAGVRILVVRHQSRDPDFGEHRS